MSSALNACNLNSRLKPLLGLTASLLWSGYVAAQSMAIPMPKIPSSAGPQAAGESGDWYAELQLYLLEKPVEDGALVRVLLRRAMESHDESTGDMNGSRS